MVKVSLFCLAAWVTPVIASFLTMIAIAGATSKILGSKLYPFILLVVIADVVFFAGASVVLHRLLQPLVEAPARTWLFLGHTLVQLVLLAFLAIGSLVAFNR